MDVTLCMTATCDSIESYGYTDRMLAQDIVTWKGELYFVDEPTADPAKLEGSLVGFSKNGQMQGIAYRLLPGFTIGPFCTILSYQQLERLQSACKDSPVSICIYCIICVAVLESVSGLS